ncbi:MAG TPA: 3-phosphoshikimate 1-carboxyvinyltransferase [Dongiaceae bacterium]|nr:3-phosphoshikimate 1-carboxyvinyltransferase [Dongiaceae bacterium]
MALPDLIEIVLLDKPVRAEITVPGSKSITNRALILAALADGEITLTGALWSEDTQIMVECLQKLGFEIRVENDPEEFCNRAITVKGLGGKIPNGGTTEKPLELFVGNAGTAARFLSAFVCLGNGVYRLSGVARMHERPQAALFSALRELGYRVESENGNDKLPVKIYGRDAVSASQNVPEKVRDGDTPSVPKKCRVSIEESSQFASALLLCAKVGNWKIEVVGENAEESPYVAMTLKLMEVFPKNGGTFQIEPDASSGSYFLVIDRLVPHGPEHLEYSEQFGIEVPTNELNRIDVAHWPDSGWQVDELFRNYLLLGNCAREAHELDRKRVPVNRELLDKLTKRSPKWTISRKNDLGDSIMTAIVWSAEEESRFILSDEKTFQFTDLGRLRLQETERVVALRTELTRCGAKVVEEGDTLTVWPSPLHGAEIETYNDHRMAMCFAILGLKVPGIKIKNPACVKKTFPNFFQKLAAQPPHGLGATILDAKSGRKLELNELFAD